jgi:hypothetical protein
LSRLVAVICQGGKTDPVIQIIDEGYLVAGPAFDKLVRCKAGYYDLHINGDGMEEYDTGVLCTLGVDTPCTSVKAGWLSQHVFRMITLKGVQPRDLDGSLTLVLEAKQS